MNKRKRIFYLIIFVWAAWVLSLNFILSGQTSVENLNKIFWLSLVIMGAIMSGWLFVPMTKASFPQKTDQRLKDNPNLLLEDHEIMTGHYGFAALTALLVSLIISPLFYGRQIIFDVQSLDFTWAVCVSGALNVGIYYFFIKAIRYGDISQISIFQGLIPVLTIPVSYLMYYMLGRPTHISAPDVTTLGLIGIFLIVLATIANMLAQSSKKSKKNKSSINLGWFSRFPQISAGISVLFASVSINTDKVAVDSGNPFIFAVVVLLIIAFITGIWVVKQKGISRLIFLFQNYLANFIKVGIVYGLCVVFMNVALYGNNVNYISATKRISIIFATLFGIIVLKEGITLKHKIIRLCSSVVIMVGIYLMVVKG
ncbi:hypothetical protein KAJ89_05070 [Candidatus Parcubacteria bacterium]|nr:hypothetical protein [Candidatus Parcubacteria bacterium]